MEIYYQKDPRWCKAKIGKTDIYNHGCAVCCLASMCSYYDKQETPKTLANSLVFDENSLVCWSSMRPVHPSIKFISRRECPKDPAPIREIDKHLNDGYPVLVETRHLHKYPHWVLIWKIIKGKHLIVDPLLGDVAFFEDRYGEPARWIYKWVLYKGDVIDYAREVKELCDELCRIINLNK